MVWPLLDLSPSTPKVEDTEEPKLMHCLFAHFPGIKGPVTDPGFEGWMPIEDIRWSASMTIRSNYNDDAGELNENEYPERESSDAYVSELTLSKTVGPESAILLFNFMAKKALDVTLTTVHRSTTTGVLSRVQSVTVYNALISGYVNNAGYGASSAYRNRRSAENGEILTLNFSALEASYYDADGTPGYATHYHLSTHTTTLKRWNAGVKHFEVMDVYKKTLRPRRAEEDSTGAVADDDDDDDDDEEEEENDADTVTPDESTDQVNNEAES